MNAADRTNPARFIFNDLWRTDSEFPHSLYVQDQYGNDVQRVALSDWDVQELSTQLRTSGIPVSR